MTHAGSIKASFTSLANTTNRLMTIWSWKCFTAVPQLQNNPIWQYLIEKYNFYAFFNSQSLRQLCVRDVSALYVTQTELICISAENISDTPLTSPRKYGQVLKKLSRCQTWPWEASAMNKFSTILLAVHHSLRLDTLNTLAVCRKLRILQIQNL